MVLCAFSPTFAPTSALLFQGLSLGSKRILHAWSIGRRMTRARPKGRSVHAPSKTGNQLLASLAPADLALLKPDLEHVELPLRRQLEVHSRAIEYVYFLESGLAERVEAEGRNSPADILSVVDYGNLIDMVERGLTQPIHSGVLDAAVPANLRAT